MKQSSLFDKPETAPYVPWSETSKAAAERIEPSMKSLKGKLLAYLREHGPMTDDEMQKFIPMNPSTQRPRRIELVSKGLVRPRLIDGMKVKGITTSGSLAQVWEAV